MTRTLGRLIRSSRGGALIEMAAAVFVLMLFAIGIARISFLVMDLDRDTRAVRSALDIIWQVDKDSASPTASDIDEVADAIGRIARLSDGDAFRMHVSVFDADVSGIPSLLWQHSSGNSVSYPPPQATISGNAVAIGGKVFSVRDDEKLIVVEILRDGHGMARGELLHRYGVSYKEDPVP